MSDVRRVGHGLDAAVQKRHAWNADSLPRRFDVTGTDVRALLAGERPFLPLWALTFTPEVTGGSATLHRSMEVTGVADDRL